MFGRLGLANQSQIWLAYAVAVDAAGNAVAAGQNTATGYNFMVAKFDGINGAELWRQVINSSVAGSDDYATAIAVDGAGNVVAAGVTNQVCNDYNCYSGQFTVMKFNGVTGAELWRQQIHGTANRYGWSSAIAVDAAGNVVAAGVTENSGPGWDFTVIKFNGATGAELWRKVINGTANGYDYANSIAIDAADDITAVGSISNNATFSDFTVIKFNGMAGAELWRQVINGTANSFDSASEVAVDAAGNVLASGITANNGSSNDFTVIKFNGVTGAELWRQVINGTANSFDSASEVAVDTAGNVLAAGYTVNKDTDSDFTVIKFNGATGAELWRKVINGTANSNDRATGDLTVDGAGNVVAAGSIREVDTDGRFILIKFNGVTGAEFWRVILGSGAANHYDDMALAVAVDRVNNVVAAGITNNTGASSEFTVIKLSPEGDTAHTR